MLKKLLCTQEKDFPVVSAILVFSCLLVSIPVFLYPFLREVVSAADPGVYPWWFLTAVFVHEDQIIPLHLHLIGNITVIAFYGILIEKLLGSTRILILAGVALTAQLGISTILQSFGNGASGIAWAFAPLALPVLYYECKKKGMKVLADPFFLFATALYILIWVIITIESQKRGMRTTNIWHLVATLVGFGFLFIWRKHIVSAIAGLERKGQERRRVADFWVRRAIVFLPLFLAVILFGSFVGIIGDWSSAKMISVNPSTGLIEDINKIGGYIAIQFDQPMSASYYRQTSVRSESGELEVSFDWEDSKTLLVHFSRDLQKGDQIKLLLRNFTDVQNRTLKEQIKLEYH